MFDYFLILIVALATIRATRHGLYEGFPTAIGFLLFLPGYLRIPSPGALPEVTIHRIILAILLVRWSQVPRRVSPKPPTPFATLVGLALSSRVISTLLSITPVASVKDLLAFCFEGVVYYHLAVSALETAASRQAALRAVIWALIGVAVVAFVERYAGVSLPVVAITGFKYCFDGIQSTFPHRILLGYAMAMGTPLVLYLIDSAGTARQKPWYWIALASLVLVCFLADSRGGWMGMVLGGTLSFLVGSSGTRRRCLGLVVLAAATLIIRPGVRDTILDRINETNNGSVKAVSYQYRWRLWYVAISEITKSPERLAFGFGGLSTESMNLIHYFDAQQGGDIGKTGFTSWDNQYASDMIEFGLFGFGIEAVLFLTILLTFFRHWAGAPPETRGLVGATLAAVAIYTFARTNVYIFGEQLKFLFWTILAIGATAIRTPAASPTPSPFSTRPLAVPIRS